MARKKNTLEFYLLKCLCARRYKRVKGVIGMLNEPKNFLTVLAVLNTQDKKIPATIDLYECLFWQFRRYGHLVDGNMVREEWHDWSVVFLEISNVLWKFRGKFDPTSWLETSQKIYSVTFEMLKRFDAKERGNECRHCSILFSGIFSNLIRYAKDGDIVELNLPSLEEIKKVCQDNIGLDWYYLTGKDLLEDKFKDVEVEV